jgi:phenylalanyl-tRNA synthetase beta chain
MNVSYEWLREYCEFDLTPEELAEALTMAGAEVETVKAVNGDWVFELEITFNRPDLLGMIGVAREISVLTGKPLIYPRMDYETAPDRAEDVASVEVLDPDLCPRYTAQIIRGVTIAPSPDWMQRRLEAVGLRPINNVVDITNYVLYEFGQPLHAFDFETLEGGKIVVRRAQSGEIMTTIDGQECRLDPEMLVIADARRPVALAGVMGGLETEVTDSTRNLLLESAWFDPLSVRRTSKQLGIATDSSYRFERTVDFEGVPMGSRRAAYLFQELAGGEVLTGLMDVNFRSAEPRAIQTRFERIDKIAGIPIPREHARESLRRLGFQVTGETDAVITVQVPSHREEVCREIDIIEEVIRTYGYDRVPMNEDFPVRLATKSKGEKLVEKVRDLCIGFGYNEVLTCSFTGEDWNRNPDMWAGGEALRVRNPVNRDEPALRKSLLPGLLKVKRTNQDRGAKGLKIFEISHVYLPVEGRKQPEERLILAMLRDENFLALKGELEAIVKYFELDRNLAFHRIDHGYFREGMASEVLSGKERWGFVGEISEEVRTALGLKHAPFVLEVDLDRLGGQASEMKRYREISPYPPIFRDLSILVDERTYWQQLLDVIEGLEIPALKDIRFLSTYQGKPIPPGKKTIAFSMEFRSDERTLTGKEVDKEEARIMAALKDGLGATLRT